MKKNLLLLLCLFWSCTAQAANLIDVYKQAQISDPVFQQSIAQRLSTKEGLNISIASLLPSIQFTASPSVARIGYSGSNFDPVISNSGTYLNPRNLTERGLTMNLSITQTIFDFAQFSTVAQQVSLSKQADAILNAALQDLMVRVAKAYFTVLNDEENLDYAHAATLAFAEQLNAMQEQYKVGLKTITDVYTARASYDAAIATQIATKTILANDKENLRAITGVSYSHLATLRDDFPFVSPRPNKMQLWVKKALSQNWSIKSSQYNVVYMHEIINQQLAGHFPTMNVQTNFSKQIIDDINAYASFNERRGPGTTSNRSIALNINFPIFSGGAVVAQTHQAKYNYEVAQQQLETTTRSVVNTTRQSYLSIIAGISQIKADRETIQSTQSSLQGLELSYQVGAMTLINVLTQQQSVFLAQKNYANDKYAFVNNILLLKQAAGILNFNDLYTLNSWLTDKKKKWPIRKTQRISV